MGIMFEMPETSYIFNIPILYTKNVKTADNLPNPDNTATDLDPVREESAGAVSAGEQLLHVLLPDQAEAVPQALLL